MKPTNIIQYMFTVALTATLLTGCDASPQNANNNGAHQETEIISETEVKGPNGGKLLVDGKFAIEVTIFETGRPPQYQLFAYYDDKPLSPSQVDATVTLDRLDGEKNIFMLEPESNYLASEMVVTEPHSFDVTVEAKYKGKSSSWQYESHEGRTTISSKMAEDVGIRVEAAGPAQIEQTLNLLGRIEFAPDAKSTLRARFPGKILSVMKTEGDTVKAGETLITIESNESLQPYVIKAPMDGVVIKRMAQAGDVVYDSPLLEIGDLTRLRVNFHVYPVDMNTIRPGQKVMLESLDKKLTAETKLTAYLPTTERATQTMVVYAPLANTALRWVPGMTITGKAIVNQYTAPLAVKTDAIQRFRDFSVVFARVKDTYEVRMLELGIQTPEWTEVLSGIKPGQNYVTENSFLIKADIEKSGASHDH